MLARFWVGWNLDGNLNPQPLRKTQTQRVRHPEKRIGGFGDEDIDFHFLVRDGVRRGWRAGGWPGAER